MGKHSSYRVAGVAIILCLVIAGFITLVTNMPKSHDEVTSSSSSLTPVSKIEPTQSVPANQSGIMISKIRVLWYDDTGKTYTFHDYDRKGISPETWTDANLPSPENGTRQQKAAMVRFLEWDGSIERMTGTKYLIDQEVITTILNSYTLIAPPPVQSTPVSTSTVTPIQPTPEVTPAPGMLIPTSSKPCNMGDGITQVSFGYINRHNALVSLHTGDRNYFSPGDQNRGQPTSFLPGIHQNIFTVQIPENGTSIAWHLMNNTVGAGQVPEVQPGFLIEPAVGYAPLDVRFTDQSTGGTTEDPLIGSWIFGDGTSAIGSSAFHRYELPGSYESSRIISTTCGSESSTKTITVNEVSFNLESIPGDLRTFQLTDHSNGDPTVWFWDFNDGFTSWEQNPVHTWKSPGIYIIGLTVSGKNGSGTTVRKVTVE